MGLAGRAALITGAAPAAAQEELVAKARAISAMDPKIGGLAEDGPAAHELNQPKGALSFYCCR